MRFAELGEALSRLAKAVESSGEQAPLEPPKDDGKGRKWLRAVLAPVNPLIFHSGRGAAEDGERPRRPGTLTRRPTHPDNVSGIVDCPHCA